MGGEHASNAAPLTQMSQEIIEHRLLVMRQQATVWSQRLQFLIHAHPPCRHTSTHALAMATGMEEATEGGEAERKVIRGRRG